MNQKLISDIVLMVQENINWSISGNSSLFEIDPKKINMIKTEKLALCVGILTILKFKQEEMFATEENNLELDISQFLSKFPWNSDLLGYIRNISHEEKSFLEDWYYKTLAIVDKELNIGLIYETLLSFEWVFDSDGFYFVQDKSSRNRSGSYYTPQELADNSVRKLVDFVIEEQFNIKDFSLHNHENKHHFTQIANHLSSLKVIDFSCGTGQFLQSIVRYFNEYLLVLSEDLSLKQQIINQLVSNIWGVDIDFIALYIAKNEIFITTKFSGNLDLLNKHFLHGNALLPPPNTFISRSEKRTLTAKGYLYHPNLGHSWGEAEDEVNNGFDLIIGNPPWEKIRFEDKSFFRPWAQTIADMNKKDHRAKAIEGLEYDNPKLFDYYNSYTDNLKKSKTLIQQRFPHSAVGELNTYALFTELAVTNLAQNGRVCYVIKSAIVVSPVNENIFKYLLRNRLIISCFDFINKKKIFAIDSRERFCVLVIGSHNNNYFHYKSGLTTPEELFDSNVLSITSKVLDLLNPLTGMLPSVTDSKELEFLILMHTKHPVLGEVFPDCKFGRIVHYTNHAEFIESEQTDENLPVYEGKLIELYDGRYSTYEGMLPEEMYGSKASSMIVDDAMKDDPSFVPLSRYFIRKDKWSSLTKNYSGLYSLMWRSLTSASNRRTCIATILQHMPASQSVQFLQLNNNKHLTILLALFNSVVFDYMVRLKLNGIDLTQKILKQIAVPKLENFEKVVCFNRVESSIYNHIAVRVSALLGNDSRLEEFSKLILPKDYPAYRISHDKRKLAISEIDRLIALAYGVDKFTWRTILNSFPSFYNTEEIELYFYEKDHSLIK